MTGEESAAATGLARRDPDARIAIVMGSKSDWPIMQFAAETLNDLGIPFEARIVSAHRTPDEMFSFAESAAERGLAVIIAGAGGAAHLPGMVAAKTMLPVLGVPMQSAALQGLDSLLSIVQMPAGIPVGTLAIGKAGAINAALLAAAILGTADPAIRRDWRSSAPSRQRAWHATRCERLRTGRHAWDHGWRPTGPYGGRLCAPHGISRGDL